MNLEAGVIQRVLDLEEIQTFKCQGELNIAMDLREVDITFENPVSVYDESGKRLGFAALSLHSDKYKRWCWADIFLTRASPERLDLEHRIRPYYIITHDRTEFRKSDGAGGPFINLIEVNIKSLTLTTSNALVASFSPVF